MRKVVNVNDLIRDRIREDKPSDPRQKHFAAGQPVYYSHSDTPKDLLIKEYPDGRRQLVRFHRDGDEVVHELSMSIADTDDAAKVI